MAGEIIEIEVGKLKPHPRNETIYGQEDVSDLVALIDARGKIIDPIVIKDDFTIISGHRRWKAAQEIGYATVPCEIVTYDNEEEEIADLILYNADRVKTLVQKAREGMILEQALSSEAFTRKLARLKQNRTDMDDSSISDVSPDDAANSDKGLTRDKVAKAIGLSSGRTFDRIKKVVSRADALKVEGNIDDSDLLLAALNRSSVAANDLLKVSLESLSVEDRERIRTGKVAPRSFLPKSDSAQTSNTESAQFDKIKKNLTKIESSINDLAEPISLMNDADEQTLIHDQIVVLQNLLSDIDASLKF